MKISFLIAKSNNLNDSCYGYILDNLDYKANFDKADPTAWVSIIKSELLLHFLRLKKIFKDFD